MSHNYSHARENHRRGHGAWRDQVPAGLGAGPAGGLRPPRGAGGRGGGGGGARENITICLAQAKVSHVIVMFWT